MKTKPARILYLCADRGIPLNGTKGGSIHIREFVSALTKTGIDVRIIANLGDLESMVFNGVSAINLPRSSDIPDDAKFTGSNNAPVYLNELQGMAQNEVLIELLEKTFNSNPFDLIYQRYSLFSTAGIDFAMRLNIPLVLEINAPLIQESRNYRKLYLERTAVACEYYVFSKASHIVTVSRELRDYVLGIVPGAPVTVIPNGVDVERYRNSSMNPPASDKEETVIGFVGNIRPWHGVENLIEAFAGLTKIENNIKLLLVGDANKMESRLKKIIKKSAIEDKVILAGPVAHADIHHMLGTIDIAVAPYPDLDNFYFSALKIFEYMAAGKAIVASRIGQISEILENGKTALLVAPGNIDELKTALAELIKRPELRSRIAENAREEAVKNHSWTKRVTQILSIFNELEQKPKFNSSRLI